MIVDSGLIPEKQISIIYEWDTAASMRGRKIDEGK